MIKITPAILPHSYRGIETAAEKVVDAVDSVQIDFVDGHFASNRTWLFNNKDEEKLHDIMDEEMGMPYWDSLNYEFDLMVKDPLQYLETFIALGPSKMIFHIEGLKEEKTLAFFETLPDILQQAIRFGMAIGIDTDPALLAPYMPYIESIQCMGIKNVGFQAQAFDEGVFAQIKRVREL
jgi:pentose-5-phosphate-3-epimerase